MPSAPDGVRPDGHDWASGSTPPPQHWTLETAPQAYRNKFADLHPRRNLPRDDYRARLGGEEDGDDHAGKASHAGKVPRTQVNGYAVRALTFNSY